MELTKQELKIVSDALLEIYGDRPLTKYEANLYLKIIDQLSNK